MEHSIEVLATWDNLTRLSDFLDEVERLYPILTHKQRDVLRRAVDETATNIIDHGYAEAGLKPGPIRVSCTISENGDLRLTIRDRGKAYDPTTRPPPEHLFAELEHRPIGGLGIFLVHDDVDSYIYSSDTRTGWNETVITKDASSTDIGY